MPGFGGGDEILYILLKYRIINSNKYFYFGVVKRNQAVIVGGSHAFYFNRLCVLQRRDSDLRFLL